MGVSWIITNKCNKMIELKFASQEYQQFSFSQKSRPINNSLEQEHHQLRGHFFFQESIWNPADCAFNHLAYCTSIWRSPTINTTEFAFMDFLQRCVSVCVVLWLGVKRTLYPYSLFSLHQNHKVNIEVIDSLDLFVIIDGWRWDIYFQIVNIDILLYYSTYSMLIPGKL